MSTGHKSFTYLLTTPEYSLRREHDAGWETNEPPNYFLSRQTSGMHARVRFLLLARCNHLLHLNQWCHVEWEHSR